MKNKLYFIALLWLIPALANALGLGRLDLNSALNEPFDARIELLSPTADELDSLNIGLADSEAFARAGIDRPFILGNLKFALRRSGDDSPDYIRVFSNEPIREPFLNFLVEVRWSKGRLYREYTVLLDPPLYDPGRRQTEIKPKTDLRPATVADSAEPGHKVVYADDFDSYAAPATGAGVSPVSPVINYSGGDYGPTTGSDTLWSIASAMRPDASISVNQMMLALLRSNPEAFVDNNVNGLKRGQILRVPSENELNALGATEALAEVKQHHSAWDNIKGDFSAAVSERPESTSTPGPSADEVSQADTVSDAPVSDTPGDVNEVTEVSPDPELKLVAADDTGAVAEQAAVVDSDSNQELLLAQESIHALAEENTELKDKLQESEALLDDLKRLLELKDDELATLQEQMATRQMAAETAAEQQVAEEPVAEVVEAEQQVAEEPVAEAAEAAASEVISLNDLSLPAEEAVEAEVAEEPVAEVEAAAEAEVAEEPVAEVEAATEAPVAEEEVIETVEQEPAPAPGIMDTVGQYIGPVKDILLGNPIIGIAVGGIILVLIIIVVLMKFRKSAEVMHIDAATEEAFPDFDSGDLGDSDDVFSDSESATVLPEPEPEPAPEVETAMPEAEAVAARHDEPEQPVAAPETPAVAEEPDEDPLQEVNTYLAFEQFDQAEEMVRNVINNDPDNPEYHTKLLEVFYTSGNKKAYEEAARVLHEKVGGAGEHWNTATAMWQEMSPNRALFEEGADAEEDSVAEGSTGVGFVDVTAKEENAEQDAGLDFDIGGGDDEDLIDVTAAVGLGESDTENIPAPADDALDIGGGDDSSGDSEPDDDDLLETAVFDIEPDTDADSAAAAGPGETVEFDIRDTGAEESAADDKALEFEVADEGASSGDDGGLELELDNAGIEMEVTDEQSDAGASDDAISLDFDMDEAEPGDGGEAVSLDMDAEPDDGGAVSLDMDAEPDDDGAVSLDMDAEPDDGGAISLDMDAEPDDDGAVSLDMDAEPDDGGAVSLDMDAAEPDDDGAVSLDMDAEPDDGGAVSLDMDMAEEEGKIEPAPSETADDSALESAVERDAGNDADFDLSLDEADEVPVVADNGLDDTLDATVQMPNIADAAGADDDLDDTLDNTIQIPNTAGAADGMDETVAIDDDLNDTLDNTIQIPNTADAADGMDETVAIDDDLDDTVFVPKAAQTEEQTVEDEVATKLDLAHAYVEVGDTDSAKTVLDEIMAEGNDEQRKQAQELMAQT